MYLLFHYSKTYTCNRRALESYNWTQSVRLSSCKSRWWNRDLPCCPWNSEIPDTGRQPEARKRRDLLHWWSNLTILWNEDKTKDQIIHVSEIRLNSYYLMFIGRYSVGTVVKIFIENKDDDWELYILDYRWFDHRQKLWNNSTANWNRWWQQYCPN